VTASDRARNEYRRSPLGGTASPRVRPLKSDGPLATLVIAYRN